MLNAQREMQRAGTALNGGDPRAAARVCQKILTDNPRDVEARYLHGRCLAALGSFREAASEFRRVLSARHDHFAALVDLGITETLGGNYLDARQFLERARLLDARPAQVHFGLGLCRLETGDPAGAVAAFDDALKRHPAFPDALNGRGVAYDRQGHMDQAVDSFRQALAVRPDFFDAQRNLADCLRRRGEHRAAADAFERCAAVRPDEAVVWADLGAVRLSLRDLKPAIDSLNRALALNERAAGVHANLGEALRLAGDLNAAEAAFRRALELEPRLDAVHLGLARLALKRQDIAGARAHLDAAAERFAGDAGLGAALALELEEFGSVERALAVAKQAIGANPTDAGLKDLEGAILHRAGRLAEALDSYELALEMDETRADTLIKVGQALETLGALSRAVSSFQQALALRPDDAVALAGLVSCALRGCDFARLDASLAELRALPSGIDALQPFVMLACGEAPADISASLDRRAASAAWPSASEATIRIRALDAPLRVAYVSPDFRTHPVATALAGMIELHDRRHVEPIGIALRSGDGSDVERRLRAGFDEFIDVSQLSNRDTVSLMRDRGIDIAIDVAGLTAHARTAIFSMRAAPIQINYLGYPGSMGVRFMDYLVADDTIVPAAHEAFYAEKVLRLPHMYLPFDHRRPIPSACSRESAGLPQDALVFCGFNNNYKINRNVFALWMNVLKEVPGSVLWLRDMGPAAAANLRSAADDQGVESERLLFAPFEVQIEAHMNRLAAADVFLDTFPYNAHTTAQDALWAGVPVITCLGEAFAGRVGASLLRASGLEDLVCADSHEYLTRAVELARSAPERLKLRARLNSARGTAPVFDSPRYTRDFESLLRSVAS